MRLLHRASISLLLPLLGAGVVFGTAALTGACSSSSDSGTIALVAGEDDVFSATPACTAVAVSLLSDDDSGTVTQLGSTSLPASSVALSDLPSSASGTLQVAALDSTGTVQVRGTSLDLSIGGLAGETLDVYVQRIGQSSRMPNALSTVHTAPQVVISDQRYIAAVDPGAASATLDLYDLLAFAPTTSVTIDRAANSLVASNTLLVAIDANGATYVDLLDLSSGELTAPAGASFADVAGGQTVVSPTNVSFVVGATRQTGAATAQILVVAADGSTSFAQLQTPRLGAAAAYVTGRGLVVVGGSALTGAAGAELLADGASTSTELPLPLDPTIGAGAVALDNETVLVAGGTLTDSDGGVDSGLTRLLDLACTTGSCVTAWPALPETLSPTTAFLVSGTAGSQSALLVGDDPTTLTHAVRIDATAATEVPLREARQAARAVVLPTQGIAIVGGTADIESYLP